MISNDIWEKDVKRKVVWNYGQKFLGEKLIHFFGNGEAASFFQLYYPLSAASVCVVISSSPQRKPRRKKIKVN